MIIRVRLGSGPMRHPLHPLRIPTNIHRHLEVYLNLSLQKQNEINESRYQLSMVITLYDQFNNNQSTAQEVLCGLFFFVTNAS
jgi:hypothetical protein